MNLGVHMGAAIFNDGENAVLDLLTELDIEPGENAVSGCLRADERRLTSAATKATMEARKAARLARIAAKEAAEAGEGAYYAPGGFD